MTSTIVREEFMRNLGQWKREAAFMSSAIEMSMLPCYRRIIDLGPAAVPLIIEHLREKPDFLFWALNVIVGVDMAVMADTVPLAAKAWVCWYDGLPDKSQYDD